MQSHLILDNDNDTPQHTASQSLSEKPDNLDKAFVPDGPGKIERLEKSGKTFSAWLFDEIQHHSSPNHICKTQDGYAISDPEIFKVYSRIYKGRNWQEIRKDFLTMKCHQECTYKVTFGANLTHNALLISDLDSLSNLQKPTVKKY